MTPERQSELVRLLIHALWAFTALYALRTVVELVHWLGRP